MAMNKQYTKEPTMVKAKIKTPAYRPEKSVTADLHTPTDRGDNQNRKPNI
jgi:hypothetical protein